MEAVLELLMHIVHVDYTIQEILIQYPLPNFSRDLVKPLMIIGYQVCSFSIVNEPQSTCEGCV